ncbi:TNF receptor-associated factor 2 [Protopterus annectens]|uniref:TNF receptor-associated factor 2 n=1 Tax=Protopterus annectens TaxID=7888 RepID=UPI001CFBBE9F|nr:TNF receptor-associated factor 2 [Protopterus annectens]
MATASSPPGSLEPQQPGFPKVIVEAKLEGKYLCCHCGLILRKPYQVQCGHRYCSYCLRTITSNGPRTCTACLQEGSFGEESTIDITLAFADNAARREVESLPAVCSNEGCTWKGTIKEYEINHEGNCEHMLVVCPACKGMVKLNDRDRHLERVCPERTLSCKYCKILFHFPQIKAHDDICPKFPLACEGCGKKKIPREKFPDHIRSCGKYRQPCKFHVIGCEAIVENEKMLEHEQIAVSEHLQLMMNYVLRMQNVTHQSLQDFIYTDPSSAKKEQSIHLDSGLTSLQGRTEESAVNFEHKEYAASLLELKMKCENLDLKIPTLENIVCVLNREVERLSQTHDAFIHQHRLEVDRMQVFINKVHQLERALAAKDKILRETEEKMRNMYSATYDGVFIWKIQDFSQKRQEAIAGRAPAMFSPAFYTSKYGYKMCLRIYLNGDGTGRGTHLSLFFVVMKGPSDALLKWPFNQKVTLMLLDQNNREHIIDAFRPDVTSSSFQRPVSDMNIASGCPLFCPLSKLESKNSYVRDDTIFIKAIVDLTGI